MATTAVQDRLALSVAEVKSYLKIEEDGEDADVAILLQSAKEKADDFLNNPFLNADGTEKDIPDTVKLWCMKYCARHHRNRPEGLEEESLDELGRLKWSGREDYSLLRTLRLSPGIGP